MGTDRSTWKKREAAVAAFFSCKRAVLSGSVNRDDKSCSDSTHETLFIETKLREAHAARTLHDGTRQLAAKEGKVAVVALADKHRPGFLVCIHSDDWQRVIVEYVAGLDVEAASELMRSMLRAHAQRHGQERSL